MEVSVRLVVVILLPLILASAVALSADLNHYGLFVYNTYLDRDLCFSSNKTVVLVLYENPSKSVDYSEAKFWIMHDGHVVHSGKGELEQGSWTYLWSYVFEWTPSPDDPEGWYDVKTRVTFDYSDVSTEDFVHVFLHVFYVDNSPPDPPVILGPENGSKFVFDTEFRWKAPPEEDPCGLAYSLLQVARDLNFTELVVDTVVAPSGYDSSGNLEFSFPIRLQNGTYYWRVALVDVAGNQGEWSDPLLLYWTAPGWFSYLSSVFGSNVGRAGLIGSLAALVYATVKLLREKFGSKLRRPSE